MSNLWNEQRVLGLPWIQALKPAGEPFLAPLMAGLPLHVWHVPVQFEAWRTPEGVAKVWAADKKKFVAGTWQKAPLVEGRHSGCEYSCGEVELAARLRSAGYDASWVSEWSGFPHVPCWEEFCVKRSEFKDRRPDLWGADQTIRSRDRAVLAALGKQGGHPDVGATRSADPPVYVEYKGPGDKIKPKQYEWARALVDGEMDLRYVAAYGTLS